MYILTNCKWYLIIVTMNFAHQSNVFLKSFLLNRKSWWFQLPLVVDVILISVFYKLHRTLQSTVGNSLSVSEKVTRVSPRKRIVPTQTEVGQDQIHLESHSGLGPVNPIWHSFMNLQQEISKTGSGLHFFSYLMHHHVVKVQDIIPKRGGSCGYHEVGLHHVEPHPLLVHPLHHQGSVTLHRDWGAGQPDHLQWRFLVNTR